MRKIKHGVCLSFLHVAAADVLTDFFSFRVSAGAHCAWWDTQYPGDYEHWRFADGFIQGWDDAYMFFSLSRGQGASVSEIGFKGAWAKRRAAEHARQKGDKGLWEYGAFFSYSFVGCSFFAHVVMTDNRTWSCAGHYGSDGGRKSIFRLIPSAFIPRLYFSFALIGLVAFLA